MSIEESLPPDYTNGRAAFESGNYRQAVFLLETAMAELEPRTPLGGEVQLWLVTAYEANGNLEEAIGLCAQLTRHPKLEIRQESKRVLYILQAPALTMKEEWIVKIPDLQDIEENEKSGGGAAKRRSAPPVKKLPPPPPIDPKDINTKDNGFIATLLILALLGMASLAFAALY
jgi:Tetratricopeptide repeat